MDQKDKSKLMVLMQGIEAEKLKESLDNVSPMSRPNSPQNVSSFCTMSNFQSSIVYLSQELQNLGFRYKLIEANGDKLNLVALVNSSWDVIQLYHAAIKDGNMLHDSRRRDVADISHLQGSVRDLKLEIEDKDRLLQDAQEKERQANSINKALAVKFKSEKEENRRLNSVLQQRDIQHQHEMKKKELEMNKLQDRLHRLVSGDRGTEGRMSAMTMTGSLNRSDRARGRWRTDNASIKQEEELYRRVLGQYESWVGQLTEEGDLLKECLSSVSAKISKMAAKCAKSQVSSLANEKELNESLACSVLSSDSLEDEPLFSLNFLSVKDRIQKGLEDNLQLIGHQLNTKGHQIESDVKQENILDSPKWRDSDCDGSFESTLDQLAQGLCVEKESDLKDQMNQLRVLKKKLQQERDAFADAAVRLNRERASFEAEKVELLRRQFLDELPATLLNNSKDPFTPNTSMESPLNQSLSDLYGDSPPHATAIPAVTSPSGAVVHSNQPVTLGPTRLPRHHRENKLGAGPRGLGGKSEPSTRNSSLSRSSDARLLQEISRAKTLERPASRSTCPTPFVGDRERGIVSPNRSLTRGVKRSPLMSLPHNTSLSQSINCPPVEHKGHNPQRRSARHSGEFSGGVSSPLGSPRPQTPSVRSGGEECLSWDSGFYHDDADTSVALTKDAQTNCRLNALEGSLMRLLSQINDREKGALAPPRDGGNSSPARRDADLAPGKRSSTAFLADMPLGPPFSSVFSASNPSPCASPTPLASHPDPSRRLSRLGSAPGSLGSSRKSSRDRKTGEDYLKKIQNNIAKWYWK